jgi:hypothetical protein
MLFFSWSFCASGNDTTLNIKYLEAQTKNQEAQARYYDKQVAKNRLNITDLVPVVGTLLAAGLGFLSLYFQARQTRKADKEKWDKTQKSEGERLDRVKKEDDLRNIRLAGADLMGKTAIAAHNLTWILWIAKNDADGFTHDLVKDHDEKMSKIYPEIVNAQVILAAHDKSLYYKTEDIVKEMYHYDGELGRLAIELRKGNQAVIKDLGDMWQMVYNFSLSIPDKFATVLKSILTHDK